MVAGWNPFYLLIYKKHKFHILHFPNSTELLTKPTGRRYSKYRVSLDIALIRTLSHSSLPEEGSSAQEVSFWA